MRDKWDNSKNKLMWYILIDLFWQGSGLFIIGIKDFGCLVGTKQNSNACSLPSVGDHNILTGPTLDILEP